MCGCPGQPFPWPGHLCMKPRTFIPASSLLKYLGVNANALKRVGLDGRKLLTDAEAQRVIESERAIQGERFLAEAQAELAQMLEAARAARHPDTRGK